jgi:hypothetical protein
MTTEIVDLPIKNSNIIAMIAMLVDDLPIKISNFQ